MGHEIPGADVLAGALPERVEFLTSLLESTNDLVWCTSADGQELLYLNRAAERIYGRPLSVLTQNPNIWIEAIHPDDRDRVAENLLQLMNHQQIEQEYRIIRPDGEVRWLRDRVAVIYDDGRPVRVGGIATDISRRKQAEADLSRSNQQLLQEVAERKQAEEASRDSEALYHSLVENLPIYVTRIDLDGCITYVNNNYCQLIGLTFDQIVGKTNFDFHEWEFAEKYRADEVRVAETGETFTDVEENRRGDETKYYEVWKSPVRNDAGRVVEIQAVFWDVTERHNAEVRREQDQAALKEAKEAAEAANRAKSAFLANMSHEIRTPMNAIIGMSELMLDGSLQPTQREYVEIVSESAESLLSIINDLLDFSKIEAGKTTLDAIDFDLRECLGDAMKTLAIRAHRKGLELAVHVVQDVPPELIGDPTRLRQMVINLVGNAIKFTETGEVVLHVENEHCDESHAAIRFQVTDTGIGIPADRLEHIFDAFEQADNSTTREFGGTGLGLAITARLARLMGGEVSVTSQPGQGSEFRFTGHFDRSRVDASQMQLPNPEIFDGMRVLVVDDNSTNRRILEEMLRAHHMEPIVVGSGAEALQILSQSQEMGEEFPLVVTDVNMPSMDGYTMVEQIRQSLDLNQPVVLVLTSGDRQGERSRCDKLNVAAHLLKPIKQSELFDAIVLAFGMREPATDDQRPAAVDHQFHVPPLRILLAEDAYANQMLAVGLLKKWNHQVDVAGDGVEAVERIQQESYDLVLMDIQMPKMDGFEATAVIRKLEAEHQLDHLSRHPIPIIAMTAHAMKGDRERCLEAGMDGYVSKPIRINELLAAVSNFFDDTSTPLAAKSTTLPDISQSRTESSTVDWAVALKAVNGDMDLLRVVTEAFLEECPCHREQLANAVESGDYATLHRVAHLIRGVCSTFGSQNACAFAERLETMGRDANTNGADECLRKLDRALDSLVESLNQFVSGDVDPVGQ